MFEHADIRHSPFAGSQECPSTYEGVMRDFFDVMYIVREQDDSTSESEKSRKTDESGKKGDLPFLTRSKRAHSGALSGIFLSPAFLRVAAVSLSTSPSSTPLEPSPKSSVEEPSARARQHDGGVSTNAFSNKIGQLK